jgi:hypothetical protein
MQQLAQAEQGGASFWTEAFGEKVRVRIRHAYDAVAELHGFSGYGDIFIRARQVILEQEGLEYLYGEGLPEYTDFESFLRHGPDELYPTAIEALVSSIHRWDREQQARMYYSSDRGYATEFIDSVSEIFAQERVAWKFVRGELVELKSEELHVAVVEPALHLIHDRRFTSVDATYRKALDELSRGDGGDAVTDAGAALQELLTALGCDGNSLGPLIKSAREKGLLAAHDTPMLTAVEKAMHWVSADRSETGESHHASDATRGDAWLIVHVVGAFIVRLASGEHRSNG